MLLTEGILVGVVTAKVVCVRTAKDQDTMLENALMLPFVTIVDFQGILLQSVPQNPYVGTVESPGTWPETARTRGSATRVGKPATVRGNAPLLRCHLAT